MGVLRWAALDRKMRRGVLPYTGMCCSSKASHFIANRLPYGWQQTTGKSQQRQPMACFS